MSAMLYHTLLRIGTIVIVAALAVSTRGDPPLWLTLVLSVGFGHYVLSFLYAKEPIRRVLARPQSIAALLALTILSCGLYAQQFSLLIAFGIHHVFNEVYLPDRILSAAEVAAARWLRLARVALNFSIYFVLLRAAPEIRSWNRPLLYGALAVSAFAVLMLLLRLRRTVRSRVFLDLCAFEIVGLLMVGVSFFYMVRFLDVVLYHFVFWAFYPLPALVRRGASPGMIYAALNLLLTAAFFLLSPVSPLLSLFTAPQWYNQFRFWSYIHILTAFAFSTAFPDWITRWFKAPVARVAAGSSAT